MSDDLKLRWKVEREILRSNVDSRGRLIVLALLAKVDNDTAVTAAEHTPSFDTLAAMTGLSKAVLSEWLQALEDGGWVTRSKPESGGKGNRTIYTLRKGSDTITRRSRALRVPRPRSKGSLGEPLEAEPGPAHVGQRVRPANPSEGLNSSPSEPFGDPKGFAQRTPNSSPSEPFEPPKGSPSEPATTKALPTGELITKTHHAAPSAEMPVNPAPQPPARWVGADQKPTTPIAVHGATAALFPTPKPAAVESWMHIHQVIYRWLQANGYATFGLDEVREIHGNLIAAHPGKPLGYLTAVIGNGGCSAYAAPIRTARNKRISGIITEMQATLPQCEHGTPAGNHPHPTRGDLLCAHCRRGLPAITQDEATNPAVQIALNAYRRARGNDILIGELLSTTQQIEGLVAAGADLDDLTALAELAGAQRVSLIQAAGAAA